MKNELILGDCLEVMKDIPDGSIDMVLCDLPYGILKCDWDVIIPFLPLWMQYERVIKENGAIVLTASQPFTTDLIQSNRKLFRYEIIWHKTQKTGFYNANKMPLKAHENILVFYKKLPLYNAQKTYVEERIGSTRQRKGGNVYEGYGDAGPSSYTKDGSRYPESVVKFSNWNGALFGNNDNATKHPTQKPVPLFEYLIRTYTNEGETVLDNCAGSGTTAIACLQSNRNYICIEKDPDYYAAAQKRLRQYRSQLKIFAT